MFAGILSVLAIGIIGGAISPLLVKLAVRELPPITLTALRFVLATLVFLPFPLLHKESLSRKDWIYLAKNSLFFTLNIIFFSIGIQFTTTIVSQILYGTVSLIVGIFSYILLGEAFTRYKVIGSIIAFTGLLFLVYQSFGETGILTFGTPLGNLLVGCAVVSFALYIVLSKNATDRYSPVTTTFASFLVTTLIATSLAPIEFFVRPVVISNITFVGIGSIVGLSIVSSALMFFLIQFAIKRVGPFNASFYHYIAPFAVNLTAIPILGERLTSSLVIGGLLILAGVFLATTYSQLKKRM